MININTICQQKICDREFKYKGQSKVTLNVFSSLFLVGFVFILSLY